MIWMWSGLLRTDEWSDQILEAQNSHGGTGLRLHLLWQIKLTHELRFCKLHLNCLGFKLLPEMAIKFRNLLRSLHWFLSWFLYCYLLISVICGCMSCWTPWVFSPSKTPSVTFQNLFFIVIFSCPELSKLRVQYIFGIILNELVQVFEILCTLHYRRRKHYQASYPH